MAITEKSGFTISVNEYLFSKVDVGDSILVIGKAREFNNEMYVMPEIIKKIDLGWLNVRKFELTNSVFEKRQQGKKESSPAEEITENFIESVYSIIKELDTGDGVSIEEVLKSSKTSHAEDIVKKLLANGDIFEIKPGRLKVLE